MKLLVVDVKANEEQLAQLNDAKNNDLITAKEKE